MNISKFNKLLWYLQTNITMLKNNLVIAKKIDVDHAEDSISWDMGSEEKEITVDIQHMSNSAHWHFWIIWVVVIGIAWFLYSIFHWILLVITGVVIAIALESLIGYFEWKFGKRRLAILLSYVLFIGLLLSGVLVMAPFLINQLSDLVIVIVNWASQFEQTLKSSGLHDTIKNLSIYRYLLSFWIDLVEPKYIDYLQWLLQNNISAIISFSSAYAKNAGQIVISTVSGIISTLTQLWFVLTLSVLLSIEKKWFIDLVYRISDHSKAAKLKLTLLYEKLWFWLKTQIMLALFIWMAMRTALRVMALFWLDLTNKWSLAVISALTELLPYLWPLLWGIPVVLMASISYGLSWFLVAALVVFCVQRLENNVLIPLLFKQNLGVSPVLIFLCMVLGWITVGINGVILAIPFAVIISILLSRSK